MDITSLFLRMGLALGLGLLVGLQRERASKIMAGIRTFPIVTIFGALSALLATAYGGWIVAAGLLAVLILILISNLIQLRQGTAEPGLTTDAALLLMFGIGAYLMGGELELGIALGGCVAVLLQLKESLHNLVRKLGDQDIKAIMQLALITLVILPVLPNRAYGPGPYQVLNPFKIWLLVVLIVSLSLASYVAYKFVSARTGALLGGLLGGLISSTATTVNYARLSRSDPAQSGPAAAAIMLASTVLYGRVLVLIAIVTPALWPQVFVPLLILTGLTLLLSLGAMVNLPRATPAPAGPGNPAELKSALVFAVVFAVILLLVAVAKDYLGNAGLYGVALLAGLTDVDAITLATARLTGGARTALSADMAWRVIVVASLANLVFKLGVTAFLGSRALLGRVAILFSLTLIGGLALVLFWPGG